MKSIVATPFLTLFFFSFITAHAQEDPKLQWVASEFVENTATGANIASDIYGNIFSITTQTDLNPLVGFVLVKYDIDGNKLWERNYEGLLPHLYYGPAIDQDGNAYVSINYGGLPGLLTYTIILKYAPDGELLWEKAFDDGTDNLTNLLVSDASGLLYFSGGVIDSTGSQDFYVGCLDQQDGDILWRVDQPGNVGSFNMKLFEDKLVLFGSGWPVPDSSTRYHLIQQFSRDGEILATHIWDGTDIFRPDFNHITDEGDVLIGSRGFAYKATKISLEGDTIWHYNKPLIYDAAFVRGLTSDDSLNTYITGGWSQTGTWIDFVTTKLSPEGEVLWENIYFLENDSTGDVGNNIKIDSNYVYAIGSSGKYNNNYFTTILIMDRVTGGTLYDLIIESDSTNTGEDLVLLPEGFAFCGKSNSDVLKSVKLVTGYYKFSYPVSTTETLEKADPFILYPNPASNVVYVQKSKRTSGKKTAELYGTNGQLLAMEPFSNGDKIKIQVGHLPAGLYVMKVGNQALKFNVAR